MKDFDLWSLALKKLEQELEIVLVLVVQHSGSSPGKQGFKMMISEENDQTGSIGGGVMELNTIELAKELLDNQQEKVILQVQEHHTKAPPEQQSGLICSGKQTNLLVKLSGKEAKLLISTILDYYQDSNFGWLHVDERGIKLVPNSSQSIHKKFVDGQNWYYLERVGDPFTVHVFGGGHVGRAITEVLQSLDFFVILYDNREGLKMMANNPYPNKKITGDYAEIANTVREGPKSFVVIATFGMDHDATVLEQVVNKELGFLGLMGSNTKIRRIFNRMIENGVSRDRLNQIEAPIGLPINDETAEEIAISVAAQLIKYKNRPSEY